MQPVNDNGLVGENAAELRIVIAPPFYRSWIAYIIYALMLVGVILLVNCMRDL